MTISTNYEPVKYTGNSVTTVFTFSYPFFASTDLLVYLDGVLQTTGYTVSGGAGSSGTVTFSVAPTTGVIITIELSLPYTQLDNYVENQAFPADTLEKGLDRAALRDQQLANSIERSLVFPATLSGSLIGELPQPVDDKMLVWDGTTGLVKNGPSSSDVENVLVDAEAAAATATAQAAIATTKASEASASAAAAAATVGSITYLWASTATGTSDDLVLTPSPAITAYAAGQKFRFIVSASANTTATPTVNINGQGAKNIKKTIGGALGNLAIGDLVASTIAEIEYDGTQFQLLNIRPYSQGADIASAGTVNLSTATGDYVNITGTTTITAITLAQGQQRTVKFAGILTLTNGASLILPSGANITTAAGDTAVFRGEASGVVRCVSYQKASGQAVVGGGSVTNGTRQVLSSGTAATYTTPASCVRISARMIGGGGGGAGNHTTAGGTGGTTSFGSWTAIGGGGGQMDSSGSGGYGGIGGTGGADGTGTTKRWKGNGGANGEGRNASNKVSGGTGANSPFGGGGRGGDGSVTVNGEAASANTGAGGGGAALLTGEGAGAGGGMGEYVEFLVTSPSATYTYTIGAGGTAGTGTNAGGAGGSGIIVVDEFYV